MTAITDNTGNRNSQGEHKGGCQNCIYTDLEQFEHSLQIICMKKVTRLHNNI